MFGFNARPLAIRPIPGVVSEHHDGVAVTRHAAVIDIASALGLQERGEVKIRLNFGAVTKNFQNQIIYATDKAIAEKPRRGARFCQRLVRDHCLRTA
ncbi:MAG: hypothetical protein ACRECV_11980 [Xanthobacteraceae bacterium]